MTVNDRAPEEFVEKVKAAILAHDPFEADSLSELAIRKAAYYIYFGAGLEDQLHNITDAYVYSVYDILNFTEPFAS